MKRISLFLLFFLMLVSAVPAQDYMFKHLQVKDGLPNNQINTIFKDSKGFMWFGTSSGLARYDGYTFRNFNNIKHDETSIPDNFVQHIVEDAQGRLWMQTGSGYTVYHQDKEVFENDITPMMQEMGIPRKPDRILVDGEDRIWFYLNWTGCYRYTTGQGEAELLLVGEGGLPATASTDMLLAGDEVLISYDNGSIYSIDRNDFSVKWQLELPENPHAGAPQAYQLFLDRDQHLWIYTVDRIWLYDLRQRCWMDEWMKRIEETSKHMIRAIAQDSKGQIWIGLDQNGIEIWDKATATKVASISHDKEMENERGLQHNTISTLYEDNYGVMWVGTYKKGVSYYNESIYKFSIDPVADVNCIVEGNDGHLWLGTNEEGLIRWNPRTKSKQQFRHGEPNSVAADVIVSLLKARDGRLWIGTFWGGLDCYDGKRFHHYQQRPDDANSLANNNVWSLVEDDEGNIWIGTLGGGVQRLHPATGRFTTYTMENADLPSNYIASLCMSHTGEVIVGTASSGVVLLNPDTGRARALATTDSVELTNPSVNQVYEDSRHWIWIATRDGLNLYRPKAKKLQVVASSDASERFIAGIAEDQHGNMWITTAKGVTNIAVLDNSGHSKDSFDYMLYDDKDGLQSNAFNQRSITRLSTGRLVVGGLYGINSFEPDRIQYNHTLPRVLFADFHLFDQPVKVGQKYDGSLLLKSDINSVDAVRLAHGHNIFSIALATDDYILPEKTRYLYQLEGFNDQWLTISGAHPRLTYTNLSPGTYRLHVKAINSDGLQGGETSVLTLRIAPPFWLSPVAYVCYVLLLIALLFGVFYSIRRRERNRFIVRQLEEESRQKDQLHQLKIGFFTNISHELRTPLTLIISPLEGMLRQATGKQQQQLELMLRNANRLLNLVNQLLDFRKIESVGMQFNPSSGDVVSYVRSLIQSFLQLSEQQHLNFTFTTSVEQLLMTFDEDKLSKIMLNLLSNAFKFTPSGGSVHLSLHTVQHPVPSLLIRVADTGVGISDADKPHLFEPFYQVTPPIGMQGHTSGSGIGLSLVREYVRMHQGEVKVEDNPGGGSLFTVILPLQQLTTSAESLMVSQEPLLPAMAAKPAASAEKEKVAPDSEAVLPSDASIQAAEPDAPVEEEGTSEKKPVALVVDDSEDILIFLKEALNLHFQVVTAPDGLQAWQQIPQLMPDVIVSDVMMPQMDGLELCRWVKTDHRTQHIPFILLSARQAVEARLNGLSTGADDYVTKPFNVEVLQLRMLKLLQLSRTSQRGVIQVTPSEVEVTSVDEQLVADAIRYVENNIARSDLSVEELSQALAMSRVHLYKKLTSITGKTPIEFIRVIRLQRAAQLLRQSGRQVSEVAYQTGFNNPKYFSKYFKDEFGVSPSVYQARESK